jgi:ABC-2 type transport system permease protein
MNKIYIIWLRELKKYIRSRSRVIGSLGMPLLFLFALGFGLNSFIKVGSGDYLDFIFPGIIAMSVLMTSMSSGISVIWDKQFGFMKEMLVAPVSRTKIVIGKTLGGATTAVIQGLLIFIISMFIGVKVKSVLGLGIAVFFMVLIGFTFTALGMAFASRMEDMQAFPLVMNFVIMPMFFLSGALFPIDGIPQLLKVLTYIDPLTYGVDALRYGFIGVSHLSVWLDLAILGAFCAGAITLGGYLFNRTSV